MSLDLSTWMMIFFILSLTISIYKIYPFLTNIQLEDDDTTKHAQEKLINVVQKYITKEAQHKNSKELLVLIKNDEEFDKELFWRFNENKLNQLRRKMTV